MDVVSSEHLRTIYSLIETELKDHIASKSELVKMCRAKTSNGKCCSHRAKDNGFCGKHTKCVDLKYYTIRTIPNIVQHSHYPFEECTHLCPRFSEVRSTFATPSGFKSLDLCFQQEQCLK